jgi:hypothetical protein
MSFRHPRVTAAGLGHAPEEIVPRSTGRAIA